MIKVRLFILCTAVVLLSSCGNNESQLIDEDSIDETKVINTDSYFENFNPDESYISVTKVVTDFTQLMAMDNTFFVYGEAISSREFSQFADFISFKVIDSTMNSIVDEVIDVTIPSGSL